MTPIHAISVSTTTRPSRKNLPLLLISTCTIALSALAFPATTQAKSSAVDKNASTSTPAKKKGVSKVTYQRSASEETRSERDRRMYRECKGMHNAGACKGYTR